MDKYLLVDPTGVALVLRPVSAPLSTSGGAQAYSSRTVTGTPVVGASEARYDFSFLCHLPKPQLDKLAARVRQQETTGRAEEIVVYYAWDTHTDYGSQTRQNIPGIDPAVDPEDGLIAYYPVIQGDMELEYVLIGTADGEPRYAVQVEFTEGTIRRP